MTIPEHPLSIPGFAGRGSLHEVRSPYDGTLLARVELAGKEALDAAMSAAAGAFAEETSRDSGWKIRERLEWAAALVEKEAESLALGIAQEGGKSLVDARVEVVRAARTIRLSAEEATRRGGETLPMDKAPGTERRIAFTMREPIGVVVAISAFNHPVNLIAHQVAPALAMGNSVVVKPASQTPLSCLRLVAIFRECGFSARAVIAAPCRGADAEHLVRDARTRFLTFIGSEDVGWRLRSILNPGARFSLEHGGEAAVVVDESADLARAVPALVKGAFYHAGQVCISVQRIYAHRSVRAELESRLVEAAAKLRVGDPTDPKTDVGPLISAADQERVHEWVARAVARGGKLRLGGGKLAHQCHEVTVVADPPDDSELIAREVFGPVVSVLEYQDEADVARGVNATRNPFQAAVFTRDVDRAFRLARAIDANAVIVNDHSAFRVDWMPFGGRDRAGFGLGGVPDACREMSRPKLVVVNVGE